MASSSYGKQWFGRRRRRRHRDDLPRIDGFAAQICPSEPSRIGQVPSHHTATCGNPLLFQLPAPIAKVSTPCCDQSQQASIAWHVNTHRMERMAMRLRWR